MGLIAEAVLQGDVVERRARGEQRIAGAADAELPQVLADGASSESPERGGQRRSMNAGERRNRGK